MFNNLTPLAQLRPAASLLPLPRQEPKPVYDGHYRLPSVIPIAPENCSRPPEEQRAASQLLYAARRRAGAMFSRGKGQSKHKYKKNHKGKPDKAVAYCDCTAKNIYKFLHTYIVWLLEQGKLRPGMRLDDLIPFIQEYLDFKASYCSPDTVHTYVSYLCKAFSLEMTDFRYPGRSRGTVTQHRKGQTSPPAPYDGTFSRYFAAIFEKFPALVLFCLCTGLRKYKELARLRGSALHQDPFEGPYLMVLGKGGLIRHAPITGSAENVALVIRLCREAGDELVFSKVPDEVDVHMLRAMYASAIYLRHARPVNRLPREEQYRCRNDYAGVILDRRAMELASQAIGHKRLSVIARSYLWPILKKLRGGKLPMPMQRLMRDELHL